MQEQFATDILFVIGAALVLAFAGAVILKRAGIPQTLGFMLAGIALGLTGIIGVDAMGSLRLIVPLALGLIGYNIGHELTSENLGGRVRKLIVIVIFEASAAFWVVAVLTFMVTNQLHTALLFGAVASATAPAATADVVWEHDTEGPLTSSLMFVLAADDAVAVILTNSVLAYALWYFVPDSTTLLEVILIPIIKIIGAVVVGIAFGALFLWYVNRERDRGRVLELELGMVILLIGVALVIDFSEIFASMVFGYVVGKYISEDLEPVPVMLEKIMSPVIMIFFVLVGARMTQLLTTTTTILLVIATAAVYLIGRTVAKYVGALAGATAVGAEANIKNYLGTCLFCQAGVALGLSFIIEERFVALGGEAATVGALVLGVVAVSTMVLEAFGPLAVKQSLRKAGELSEEPCVLPETVTYEFSVKNTEDSEVDSSDPQSTFDSRVEEALED